MDKAAVSFLLDVSKEAYTTGTAVALWTSRGSRVRVRPTPQVAE